MDGTIYLGNRLFEHTLPFLQRIKNIGAEYAFLTNNSSKSISEYIIKLDKMGINANEKQIISSTNITAKFLLENYGKRPIYVLGTSSLRAELASYGLNISYELDGTEYAALVLGFDTELNFKKLEDACLLLNSGVDYIAANCDMVCPTEYGYVPDCGSFAQMLENATGRVPVFLGKPKPDIIHMALRRFDCAADDAVFIGDRLYTDIACGEAAGVDTVLVLSGESTRADAVLSPHQPDFIFEHVGEVL